MRSERLDLKGLNDIRVFIYRQEAVRSHKEENQHPAAKHTESQLINSVKHVMTLTGQRRPNRTT